MATRDTQPYIHLCSKRCCGNVRRFQWRFQESPCGFVGTPGGDEKRQMVNVEQHFFQYFSVSVTNIFHPKKDTVEDIYNYNDSKSLNITGS